MKIAAKVRRSHFSLASLVLIVGALGYFSVGRVSTQYERALRQTLPVVGALQDIRLRAEHVTAIAYRRQPGAVRGGEADEAAQAEADDLTPAFAALSDGFHRHRRLVETYFPDEQPIVDALDRESRRLREAAIELTRSPVQTAAGDAARRALKQAIDAISTATGKVCTLVSAKRFTSSRAYITGRWRSLLDRNSSAASSLGTIRR